MATNAVPATISALLDAIERTKEISELPDEQIDDALNVEVADAVAAAGLAASPTVPYLDVGDLLYKLRSNLTKLIGKDDDDAPSPSTFELTRVGSIEGSVQ